jgi:beta-glucosidase
MNRLRQARYAVQGARRLTDSTLIHKNSRREIFHDSRSPYQLSRLSITTHTLPGRSMPTPRTTALYTLLVTAVVGSSIALAQTAPPPSAADIAAEHRAAEMVAKMTLEEKVAQMQNGAPAIPRLNIPAYNYWSEGLHGIARSGYATVFPQAIGMAATFDAPLIHQEAVVISTEARAKNSEALRHDNHSIYFGLDIWSPNINIFRDPRWGRGQETYGEDPFLTSRMGVAFVTGLQGDDPRFYRTIATPKHFAVHSGPESTRHSANVDPTPHDLEDTYLPAFRATITEGAADSTMCAYNSIDGQPACANTMLLKDTLRGAWAFHGYVTSDCAAVGDISGGHKFAPDLEHADADAVLAGTDTTCGDEFVPHLTNAVHEGLLPESAIDRAVTRLFTARIRLGLFDPPASVPYAQIPFSADDSPAHRQLALEVSEESMVLLKNDGILPLSASEHGPKTIAVIGPNAAALAAIEGNYNAVPSHPVLPLTGIEERFGSSAKILYAQGSPYVDGADIPVPQSVLHPSLHSTEPGLKAEYFNGTDFSGSPVATRTDPQIDFDWNRVARARRGQQGLRRPLDRSACRSLTWRLHLQLPRRTLLPLQRRREYPRLAGWQADQRLRDAPQTVALWHHRALHRTPCRRSTSRPAHRVHARSAALRRRHHLQLGPKHPG